jgi:hypothetical protein
MLSTRLGRALTRLQMFLKGTPRDSYLAVRARLAAGDGVHHTAGGSVTGTIADALHLVAGSSASASLAAPFRPLGGIGLSCGHHTLFNRDRVFDFRQAACGHVRQKRDRSQHGRLEERSPDSHRRRYIVSRARRPEHSRDHAARGEQEVGYERVDREQEERNREYGAQIAPPRSWREFWANQGHQFHDCRS